MGYTLANSRTLSAVSSGRTIHVDPAGFCWSTVDPADAILPAIPEVLESPKEPMPWDALRSLYLRLPESGPLATARISTRVEGYSLWDELRGTGRCALAPDEHALACFLMKSSSSCELLADFITDGSSPRRYGRKAYYEAELGGAKGEETLRIVGAKSPRNAYLRRDGLLRLHRFTDAPREDWIRLLGELGEWCYFVPT